MSAPPGFNPDTSLLQQNASAPIVPFRGGGTPLSLDAFYQAILKGQPETIRKMLPESIADITNFAISVKNGKFVLKMKVKGKKKGATDEENAAVEANKTEEAIANVAASEAVTKAEADEAKKKAEEDILKQAREFLILEAARAFLRNLGNKVSSEEGKAHLRGKQSTPTPKQEPKRNYYKITAASQKTMIAQKAEKEVRNLQEFELQKKINRNAAASQTPTIVQQAGETVRASQEVVQQMKLHRNAALKQRGSTETTPRGSQGIRVEYSPSVLPPGSGQTATSKNVKQATALQAQLQSTQKPQ